jgi:hypothetical protein
MMPGPDILRADGTTRPDVPPPAAPLAPGQHKAALWADPTLAVYAVAMGQRIADLPGRLAGAGLAGVECLRPGALTAAEQRDAHHLVPLNASSAFTDWLLFETAIDFPEWGVLVRSPARPAPLRNHLRGLSRACLPGGQPIDLDWMDPPLLEALLPGFGAAELTEFFGPVRVFTVPGAAWWRHAEALHGRLAWREVPVAPARRVTRRDR